MVEQFEDPKSKTKVDNYNEDNVCLEKELAAKKKAAMKTFPDFAYLDFK